jgi:lauroyl/myristoyl acyltransferase
MSWYGRSRIGNVARALGAHNIDIALQLKEVIRALRNNRTLIGLVDIPADEAKVGQPVELLGLVANVPRGLLRLVVDQKVPVVLYVTGLNTADGSRELSIQSIGVYDTVEEVAHRLFGELDQLIRTDPAAWHFWGITNRFFGEPFASQKQS